MPFPLDMSWFNTVHKSNGNAIPVRNEGISPSNFSINLLKYLRILKKKFLRQWIRISPIKNQRIYCEWLFAKTKLILDGNGQIFYMEKQPIINLPSKPVFEDPMQENHTENPGVIF